MLSAYEQQRQANIARNKRKLQFLGLDTGILPRENKTKKRRAMSAAPGDDSADSAGAAVAEAIPVEVGPYLRTLVRELQKSQSNLRWNADGTSFYVDVSPGPPHPHAHAHAHAHGACTRTGTHVHTRNRTRIHRPAKIHI